MILGITKQLIRKCLNLGLEEQDGFMIDNEDIGRDIDLLTDQVRPLQDSPLTTVAKLVWFSNF
jgi:hypothetical protein